MDNTSNNKLFLQDEAPKFTLRELVFKYLAHLPLFLLSLVLCVGAGIIYIRYATPVYKASTKVLIKSADNNTVSSNKSGDLIESALFGGKKVNIENEIELIKAKRNLIRVVEKNGFNLSFYNEGSIKKSNIYNKKPFNFLPLKVADSSRSLSFYIKSLNVNGGLLCRSKNASDKDCVGFKWNTVNNFRGITFIISYKDSVYNLDSATKEQSYYVVWQPSIAKASQIQSSLSVTPLSNKTTILQLAIQTTNTDEGKAILNALVTDYNIQNIEEKNLVADNTIKFIEGRLVLVTDELKGVEKGMSDYKNEKQILDIKQQVTSVLSNVSDAEKAENMLDFKLQLLDVLEKYMQQNGNKNLLVPTTLGIEDLTLTALIGRYNEVQLLRLRLLPSVLSNNAQLEDLTNQREDIKRNVLENISIIRKNYTIQKKSAVDRNQLNKNFLSQVPEKERVMQEIGRQQNVKQALFLYLLQKKEETAIGSASTLSNYQQLDAAEASNIPVEPKEGNIRMYSLVLGLLIPILIIYILDLLNDKLTTRDDIIRRTSQPIVGEISHVDKTMSSIVVGQSRNMIAEQFRILRSNLQFLVKAELNCKTFLVTSSISGEGKSFISLNLAAVMSLSGKRVALLEFDLRKMRSGSYPGEQQNNKGITNYLIGQTENQEDIITHVDKFPTLHIFKSGPIPPNPGELVMSDKVQVLFEWLYKNYDYIVIDSAPVGLVSDSFALVQYSQSVIYVFRQRYTFKRQIDYMQETQKQDKLKNVAIVVNDVHMGGKYGYYGYGYGYGYGYIYRYGFGYRYGYGYGAYAGKYFKKGAEGYFDMPKKGGKK